MIETDIVKRRRRSIGRDVPAQLARFLVGADDQRHRVPAGERQDAPLEREVARPRRLLVRRDGVDIGGGGAEGQIAAGLAHLADQLLQQELRAIDALVGDDALDGIEPFARLDRIDILGLVHGGGVVAHGRGTYKCGAGAF